MKAVATLGLLAIAATGVVPAQAQSVAGTTAGAAEPTPLFSSNDPLTVTIQMPFKELFKDKSDDAPAQEGTFTYLVDGQPVTIDLKVTLRGLTRRRKCRFPPLALPSRL